MEGKQVYHTVLVVADLYHSRAKRQEEDAVLLVLGAVLGHEHVDGRLAGRVQRAGGYVVLVGKHSVGEAAGNNDNLLGLALEDERDEQVEEVDVADDVDVEQVPQGLGQLLGLGTTFVSPCQSVVPLWNVEANLQISDGVVGIEKRYNTRVANEVVEAPTGDLGRVGCSFLLNSVSIQYLTS